MCQSWFKCCTWINSSNQRAKASSPCYYHFTAYAEEGVKKGSSRPRVSELGQDLDPGLSALRVCAVGLSATLLLSHLDLLKPTQGGSWRLVSCCIISGRIFIGLGARGPMHTESTLN